MNNFLTINIIIGCYIRITFSYNSLTAFVIIKKIIIEVEELFEIARVKSNVMRP